MHVRQLGQHATDQAMKLVPTASPCYIDWVYQPDIMIEDAVGYDEAYDELMRDAEMMVALDATRDAKREALTELKARFARKA